MYHLLDRTNWRSNARIVRVAFFQAEKFWNLWQVLEIKIALYRWLYYISIWKLLRAKFQHFLAVLLKVWKVSLKHQVFSNYCHVRFWRESPVRRSLLYCKMLPKINLLHFFDARDKFREFISQIYFENQLEHKLTSTIFLRSCKVTPLFFSMFPILRGRHMFTHWYALCNMALQKIL